MDLLSTDTSIAGSDTSKNNLIRLVPKPVVHRNRNLSSKFLLAFGVAGAFLGMMDDGDGERVAAL